jgi:hypothetical protein
MRSPGVVALSASDALAALDALALVLLASDALALGPSVLAAPTIVVGPSPARQSLALQSAPPQLRRTIARRSTAATTPTRRVTEVDWQVLVKGDGAWTVRSGHWLTERCRTQTVLLTTGAPTRRKKCAATR